MAENLNKPSDFVINKQKGRDIDLLPPSAFETKVKPGDPWKEIAKATEEVLKLQLENTKLKVAAAQLPPAVPPTAPPVVVPPTVAPHTVGPSAAPQVPVILPVTECWYKPGKDDLRYIDELISKQAGEISDLKNELRSTRCQHREEVTELEHRVTLKEREYVHHIAELEAELQAAEHRYEQQVERLSREHEREVEEVGGEAGRMRQELADLRHQSRTRILALEEESVLVKQTMAESVTQLTEQIRVKQQTIDNLTKQIGQLKSYIGETENVPKPVEIARRENESLLVKLKSYASEQESLQSTVQLLNIRLNSTNEILRLQEATVSKTSKTDIEKSKQENLLLTRWREKVFALMVQQKSAEISSKKDEQNWKTKASEIEQKLCVAHNQIEQLSHSLSDKGAQLDMETNTNNRLQGEISEAQQLALCLDDRLQGNIHAAQGLQQCASSIGMKFHENFDVLNTAVASLKAYSQRISFASGRLEMLQGMFARREAVLRLQIENGGIPVRDTGECKPDTEQKLPQEESSHVMLELQAVTRERDNLAAQIKQDAATWDDKIHATRNQYEEEISVLKQKCADLECIVQEKIQKCGELSERLETCQADLDESGHTVEELKDTLAKQDLGLQSVLDEKRQEVESQCAETFATMERNLNDAKREHAKAVVSLRQLERKSARERERATEHLATVEDHYRRQLDGLQGRLKAVEKERNLMMATLRQEGLIGKLKSDRQEPVRLSSDDDESRVPASHDPVIQVVATDAPPNNDPGLFEEPLENVLEDLESLTTAVLQDDPSDSGSDGDS